jgi:hypothetical protein
MSRNPSTPTGAVAGQPSTRAFAGAVGPATEAQTGVHNYDDQHNAGTETRSASRTADSEPLCTANCATHPTQVNVRQKQAESPLTLELREFIDLVIAPMLVRQFISEQPGGEEFARGRGDVAKFPGNTSAQGPNI